MARRYTIKDLVDAQVNAARFAGKHPDLAEFHSSRYRAMARSCGLDDPAAPERIAAGLRGLERSSVEVLVGLHSPFSVFLEAPRSVRDLHSRFSGPIHDGIRQTEAAVEQLLQAVVIEAHGIPTDRTVGNDDLRRNGFDPATPWPDEFDYF